MKIKIGDYLVILNPDAENIENYKLIVENIGKMGIKSDLEQYVTSSYQFGLPYLHTIAVDHAGEILICIFEKNHQMLEKPEKVIFGQIIDYKHK